MATALWLDLKRRWRIHFWPQLWASLSLSSCCSALVFLPPPASRRPGSVSQLRLLLLFLLFVLGLRPERLVRAAACHTQGKTAWTEIKFNLYIWVCGNPSVELFVIVVFSSFSFHVLFLITSLQLVPLCPAKHWYFEGKCVIK